MGGSEKRVGPEGLKAKIICTLGPASSDRETMRRMVDAGMDIARINTGHSDIDEVRESIQALQDVENAVGRKVAVMLDLQGPRLRVGSIQGSTVELEAGREFTVTSQQKRGDSTRVSVPYAGLTSDVKPGDHIMVSDGLIRLRVDEVSGTDLRCTVLEGGPLQQGKGMNFPDSDIKLDSFTDRDRRYLEAGLKAGVDWVAQSFIRSAADVSLVKEAITTLGSDTPVMAKIEKGEAVRSIEEIIEVADGIMIARGDLGVEMEMAQVPLIQKEIIAGARRAALPVVTATQMLESMVEHPRPTRAEVSDVANAILDGTDAVMLSGETAIGHDPVEVVRTMADIAFHAEGAVDYALLLEQEAGWRHHGAADAIGYAACKIASDLGARVIVTMTRSGYTARLIARYRPEQPILAVSTSRKVVDRLAMVWGVQARLVPELADVEAAAAGVSSTCLDAGLAEPGDVVVITGGLPGRGESVTNMVHVHTVEEVP
ncbi:MAG: pyruvate kinase [Actinobacteria bacterium]|nr:pyruvate kinase [Actinomycetota bacterium]MBU1942639.1 pyruvate kinase [Actinomycetota bacterium]MBU2688959.1 pyruvate kinase [Actinomycetota bacterium]